jgi:hypothetical protein
MKYKNGFENVALKNFLKTLLNKNALHNCKAF